MIVPSSVERAYDEWSPTVSEIAGRVSDVLTRYCEREGYIFDGRVKSLESVAEKIESGRYRSWSELDDLYACTVAVPLFDDEERALRFLEERFVCAGVKRRGAVPKPPDVFRFDSTRFYGRIPPAAVPQQAPTDRLFNLVFEVQVKSLFEYAWARTTHALTYKSSMVDWRRHRLVAHLKAATEQADFLLVGFDGVAEMLGEGSCPEVDEKREIIDFFSRLLAEGRIPTESAPKDWTRFVDNFYRVVQVLCGQRPTGSSQRKLEKLPTVLQRLEAELTKVGLNQFPRSVSLFQFSLGVLATSGRFSQVEFDYHLPITSELLSLFPGVQFPGSPFECG